MNKELDAALCAKYPIIFAQRNSKSSETNMCWGFACGDGWYDLIDTLCNYISHYTIAIVEEQVVATQVKEKFGTLRFYYTGGNRYVDGLVDMAEGMSAKICDVCGSPGDRVIINKSLVATRCKEHLA